MIERHEAEIIAQATNAYRPDWPVKSIVTLIGREIDGKSLRYRPYRDVAIALAIVATDPASKTPGRVLEDGPWWTALRTTRPDQTPSHLSPRKSEICTQDGHSGYRSNCAQCRSEVTPDPTHTPAARRQLQALVAIGWTMTQLADRLGINRGYMTKVVTGTHQLTAKRIREIGHLYAQLSMQLPPEPNNYAAATARRARAYAKARRWLTPIELDLIDDQADEPTIPDSGIDEISIWRHLNGDHTPTLTRTERLEVIHRWQAAGRSLAALQRATGWNVHRDLRDRQAAS